MISQAIPPSIRADHADRTRARIVDAVVALVTEQGDATFTMPIVAEASGVSLRTLYRYFPSRQHIIDAIASVADQASASNLPDAEFELSNLGSWIENAWRNLIEREAFIRAQHTSPNGAAIRAARIPFFRDVTRTLLLREVPDLEPSRLDDLVDTVLVLVSSSTMLEFLDVMDAPMERAARLSADAILSLISSARTISPDNKRG